MNIIDLAPGNAWESGADGYIFKYGQGMLQYDWRPLAVRAIAEGKPYGGYWVVDARYSPESHKAAIKAAFPGGDFGKLGLWLDIEKPYAPLTDAQYGNLPYAYYKPVESVWRGVFAYCNRYPGWYFSPGSWDLILHSMPITLQQEVAAKCDLWIAHYTSASAPTLRGAWSKWVMWQWRAEPDYNRVDEEWWERVTGAVEPPPPPPPAQHSIEITVVSEAATLDRVTLDGADFSGAAFHVKQPAPPPPPPEPPPAPVINAWRVKWMYQRPANHRPDVYFQKPDVLAGRIDSRVPLTSELQHYWYALMCQFAPGDWDEARRQQAWRVLTAWNRAFTNRAQTEIVADYISNMNVSAKPIAIDKFRVCGGNVVNVLSETPISVMGEKCYRVQAIDPTSHPDPLQINHALTPWLVHYATNDFELPIVHVGGFPTLAGNPVQYPLLGVGGENAIWCDCLEKLDPGEPYPSPFG